MMTKKFPQWVPAGAVSAWQEVAERERRMIEASKSRPTTGPKAAHTVQEAMIEAWRTDGEPLPSEVFERLLTDQAKGAWESVGKQSATKQVGNIDPPSLLSHFLIRACWGPMFDEQMTKAEYTKHRKRAAALAEELAQLIYGTNLDSWLGRHVLNLKMWATNDERHRPAIEQIYGGRNDAIKSYLDCRDGTVGHFLGRMSGVLYEFAKAIEADQQPVVSLPKPNDANARRVYFIKSATEACMLIFGKVMRREVTILTNAAFQCEITEREMRSHAPQKKGKGNQSVPTRPVVMDSLLDNYRAS